jgi:hypothetical protein
VIDRNGKEVVHQMTDKEGSIRVELPEYDADGATRKFSAPYTIFAGKKKIETGLTKNTTVDIIM